MTSHNILNPNSNSLIFQFLHKAVSLLQLLLIKRKLNPPIRKLPFPFPLTPTFPSPSLHLPPTALSLTSHNPALIPIFQSPIFLYHFLFRISNLFLIKLLCSRVYINYCYIFLIFLFLYKYYLFWI